MIDRALSQSALLKIEFDLTDVFSLTNEFLGKLFYYGSKYFDKSFIFTSGSFLNPRFYQLLIPEIDSRNPSPLKTFLYEYFFDQLSEISFFGYWDASSYWSYEESTDRLKDEWLEREASSKPTEQICKPGRFCTLTGQEFMQKFGQVVCIGVGLIFQKHKKEKKLSFRSKCISHEQSGIPFEFKALLERRQWVLCAHKWERIWLSYYVEEWPHSLDRASRTFLQYSWEKNWEVRHLDTMEAMEVWGYKHTPDSIL